MKTAILIDRYAMLQSEIKHLGAWPIRGYGAHSVLKSMINQDMHELQQYIIPELKRRGLIEIN